MENYTFIETGINKQKLIELLFIVNNNLESIYKKNDLEKMREEIKYENDLEKMREKIKYENKKINKMELNEMELEKKLEEKLEEILEKKLIKKKGLFINELRTIINNFQKNDILNNKINLDFSRKDCYDYKIGRLYSYSSFSISKFKSCLRHYLLKDTKWIDIDIKNCHPVIMFNMIEHFNLDKSKYSNFIRYVKNREEVFKELIDYYNNDRYDKKFFKTFFISIINGRKLETVKCFLNNNVNEYILDFFNEVNDIRNKIIKNYRKKYKLDFKKIFKNITVKDGETERKLIKKVISYILGNEERKIIEEVFIYLKNNKFIKVNEERKTVRNFIYCYDGFLLLNNDNIDINKLILDLKKIIKNKLDYDIDWDTKDFSNNTIENIHNKKDYHNKTLEDFNNEYYQEFKIIFKQFNSDIIIRENKDFLRFFKVNIRKNRLNEKNIKIMENIIFQMSLYFHSINLDYSNWLNDINKRYNTNFKILSLKNNDIRTELTKTYYFLFSILENINNVKIKDFRLSIFFDSNYLLSKTNILSIKEGYIKRKNNVNYGCYSNIGRYINSFDDGISLNDIGKKNNNKNNKIKSDIILLNGFYGTGKTYNYLKIIENIKNTNKKTLIITNRRSLIFDIKQKIQTLGMSCYLNNNNKINKEWVKCEKGSLVSFMTFINYIGQNFKNVEDIDNFINSFNLVIFDEINITLSDITIDKMNKRDTGFNLFILNKLLLNTKNKIIISEGLLDKTCVDYLNRINKHRKILILDNRTIRDDKKRNFISIKNKLDIEYEGKKTKYRDIFLYIKKDIENVDNKTFLYLNNTEKIKYKIINKLNKNIKHMGYFNGSDNIDTDTNNWSNYNVILSSSKLSVGVDYQGNDYNNMITIINNNYDNINEVIQNNFRIRKLSGNTVKYFIEGFKTKYKNYDLNNLKDRLTENYLFHFNNLENNDFFDDTYKEIIINNEIKKKIRKYNECHWEYINKEVYKFDFIEQTEKDTSINYNGESIKRLTNVGNTLKKYILTYGEIGDLPGYTCPFINELNDLLKIIKNRDLQKNIDNGYNLNYLVDNDYKYMIDFLKLKYNLNDNDNLKKIIKTITKKILDKKLNNYNNYNISNLVIKYIHYILKLLEHNKLFYQNTLFHFYLTLNNKNNGNILDLILFSNNENRFNEIDTGYLNNFFTYLNDIFSISYKKVEKSKYLKSNINIFNIKNILLSNYKGFFKKKHISMFIKILLNYEVIEGNKKVSFIKKYNINIKKQNKDIYNFRLLLEYVFKIDLKLKYNNNNILYIDNMTNIGDNYYYYGYNKINKENEELKRKYKEKDDENRRLKELLKKQNNFSDYEKEIIIY